MSALKTIMAVILFALEIPAAIFLVYEWFKAKNEAGR